MKRYFYIALIMALMISCFPTQPSLQGIRISATEVQYTATEGPTLSVATATKFEGLPDGCTFIDGTDDEASCTAPAVYIFKTDGKTSATIFNGYLFVTAPVIVE